MKFDEIWQKSTLLLPVLLIMFMAIARFNQFGSSSSLPSVSLAVFFLAGTSTFGVGLFGILLLEAAIVDYVTIHYFNANDICLDVSYVFCIVSFLVMWLAGKYCKLFVRLNFINSLQATVVIVLATVLASFISNSCYYIFSGFFGELTWEEFSQQAIQSFRLYSSSTLIYIFLGLGIAKLWRLAQKSVNASP